MIVYVVITIGENTSAVLREVRAGNSVTVLNHGDPIARISPYAQSPLDVLFRNGQASEPSEDFSSYRLPPIKPDQPETAAIIADIRRDQ